MSRKIPKSLKLSLRGSVERQAQHRSDRLGPIGEAEYVNRYADRCEGGPVWCINREAIRKDIP